MEEDLMGERGITRPRRMLAFALGVGMAGAVLISALPDAAGASPTLAAHTKRMVGTFHLAAGKKSGRKATGTYFRMITPTGGYVPNGGSTYILLRPGTDGGLRTGAYQPQPSPAFNGRGDSLANKIFQPQPFENVNFGASTQATDPQTKHAVPTPSIFRSGTQLSGNLSAFSVSWNKQQFNQGSPKPNGSYPGRTTKVSGTYNATTHHYTLIWRSRIVGGPFNGFTGYWHFSGTFTAK
jgi:hypothetical protein